MKFPNKIYDILKWIALVVLPGLGVLYSTLAQTWGWPYAEQIPESLLAVCCFLGALIGVSTLEYTKRQK